MEDNPTRPGLTPLQFTFHTRWLQILFSCLCITLELRVNCRDFLREVVCLLSALSLEGRGVGEGLSAHHWPELLACLRQPSLQRVTTYWA